MTAASVHSSPTRTTFAWLATAIGALAIAATAFADLPSAYFPRDVVEPRESDGWAMLAAEFPRLIKPAAVNGAAALESPPATRVEVRAGVDYVRVRRLAADLSSIEQALQTPALVLDLRYVRGELAPAVALGRLLARKSLRIETVASDDSQLTAIEPAGTRPAGQVTLVLVNDATAGALEAVLDALQAAGDVMLVGAATKGDTGVFPETADAAAWKVIAADYRRVGGASLLDDGVTPALAVEAPAEQEEAAYLALDGGTPLATLLDAPVEKTRFDEARLLRQFGEAHANGTRAGASSAADDSPAPAETVRAATAPPDRPPFDRALQRAVSTLVALEALGRLPPQGD